MDDFERVRGRLFGIAYRMLGTATDAEEIIQEAWLRWQGVDQETVKDPGAFLAKVVTNMSIKQLTSARVRRETYVGEWLPEPVFTGQRFGELGPLEVVAERESVSFALLLLLERLTPAERAAYVLREAFAYSHREVAELIGTSEANARQLASRAAKRVAAEPRRERQVDPGEWRKLVDRFIAAAQLGEIGELEALLAADVVTRADGGGKVFAARNAITGRDRVARYLIGVLERFGAGIEPRFGTANGRPALVAVSPEGVEAVCFFEFTGDHVSDLRFVMNPDKLTFAVGQLSRIGGLRDLGWGTKGHQMGTILVTGGTGNLGRPTVEQLRAAGHEVGVLSRTTGPGLITGDLNTGSGIGAAVAGVDTIVHLATGLGRRDVQQTRNLLHATPSTTRVMVMSIAGVDRIPLPYYRTKLEVERLVAGSGTPYTILRATQFHTLLDRIFGAQRFLPVLLAPDITLQPIAVEDVAVRLTELVAQPVNGRAPDIGGPERRRVPDLARGWASARGSRRPVVPLRVPGKTFRAYASGAALVDGLSYGRITFEEYVG